MCLCLFYVQRIPLFTRDAYWVKKDLKGNKVGEERSCHWCHVDVGVDNGDAVVASWVWVP